jgi:hypothetical protein
VNNYLGLHGKGDGKASSSNALKSCLARRGDNVRFALNQPPIPKNLNELHYGVNITDSCIGWETTERMLRWGYETLKKAH